MKQEITHIIYSFALAGLLAAFGACSDDNMSEAPVEGERRLTINYTIPGSKVQTRTEGEARDKGQTRDGIVSNDTESAVKRMDLIYFESDIHNNGTFVAHQTITENYDLKKNTFTTPLPAGVETSKAYQVLIIANLDKYISNDKLATYCESFKGFQSYNQAWNELRAALPNNSGQYTYPDDLLMSGTATKPAGKDELNFELLRAAVRIDVKVAADKGITLASARLCNLPATVPFFRTGETESEKGLYVNAAKQTATSAALYAFENILDVTAPLTRINRATCLLLQVDKASSGYSTANWYRVDLNIMNGLQQLKRNHVYTVTLTDVTAAGAKTKEEAYNSASFLPSSIIIKEFTGGGTYTEGDFEFQ